MLYSVTLTILLVFSKYIALYVSDGLLIWFNHMIPALFPTILWSNLLIKSNQIRSVSKYLYKPLHKLFGVTPNGAYVIIVGFLCGFPLGAKCISDLYKEAMIDKNEATYLLSFCNLIGPAFVISFLVPHMGYTNIIPAIFALFGIPFLYGICIFRITYKKPFQSIISNKLDDKTTPLWKILDSSIYSAIRSILMLGGYIVSFQILKIVLMPLPHFISLLLLPLIEINAGIQALPAILQDINLLNNQNLVLFIKYLTICYVSFNGLCCALQTKYCLENTDLSFKHYLFHKCMITFLTFSFCVFCFYLKIGL